jgi:hypothetical protein
LIAVAGVVGIIVTLAVGLWGYAYWANSLLPYRPQLPPMPQPNGYEQATLLAARLAKPQLANWPRGSPAEIRPLVDAARPTLDQIRATFQQEWRAPPVLSVNYQFTEMAAARECARYFVAESFLEQSRSDEGEGLQRTLDAVEIGVRFPKGGTNLHALVAVALHAIGFSQAESQVSELSSRAATQALERVRRLRKILPPYSEILEGERISALASLTNSFGGHGWRTPFRALRTSWQLHQIPSETDWSQTKDVVEFWLTPKQKAFRDLDQYYQQLIAESKKPFRQRKPVPVPTGTVSEFYAGVSDTTAMQWSRVGAELALLEVALAVRMHRLQSGGYPTGLPKISREWLPAVPHDPWGQAIGYQLSEGQPTVYSLGPDGRDDGGTATNPQDLVMGAAGDLVFGVLYDRRWSRRR